MFNLESDEMTALWPIDSLTFTFYETFSNSIPVMNKVQFRPSSWQHLSNSVLKSLLSELNFPLGYSCLWWCKNNGCSQSDCVVSKSDLQAHKLILGEESLFLNLPSGWLQKETKD